MSMRAAMVTNNAGPTHAAFLAALAQGVPVDEVRMISSGGGLVKGVLRGGLLKTALQLATYRPHLVIVDETGAGSVLASLYRLVMRRSRLLVRLSETCEPMDGVAAGSLRRDAAQGGGSPVRDTFARSITLGCADGVLADGDLDTEGGRGQRARVFSLTAPRELEAFLAQPLVRAGVAVHRLVYAGPLSPRSGVADIMLCVAAWAERNPQHAVEIWWVGEGDLAGVLEAQPLPANMSQTFRGALDREAMASCLAACGLLVSPLQAGSTSSWVAEALAAGVVVIGNQRDTQARYFLQQGDLGWMFDPAQPDDILQAVGRALDSTPQQLEAMRSAGRALILRTAAQGMADMLRTILAAIMPAAVLRPTVLRNQGGEVAGDMGGTMGRSSGGGRAISRAMDRR